MTSVRKSLAVSFISQYIEIGFQLATFFVLARLLTPNDIGLFSVASAAIGIAHIFREFGVGSYLIQEKELNEDKIATVFTIALISGALFFLLLFFLAPLVADFYKDQRLIDVFRLLAFNFLIIPLNITSLTLLRREMRFNALFWLQVIGSVINFLVPVILSSNGVGYFSLVWASIANNLATSLIVSFFRRGGMFHRLTLCEWKTVLSFGAQITFTSFTSYISANANDLILAKFLGFTTTGIISRAQGVMYLFHRDITATIRNVAFPAFAIAARESRDLEFDYIKAVTVLTVFAWPFYGFFSLFSVESLRLLFGPQWDAAGPLVPWFCAGGAFSATCSLIPTLLPAIGGMRFLLRMHLLMDPLRIITFAITVYIYEDATVFAITFFIFFTFSVPVLYFFKNKLQPTQYKALFVGLVKSVLASLCALSVPIIIASWAHNTSEMLVHDEILESLTWIYKTQDDIYLKEWTLIPIGLLMIPFWLSGLIFFRHPLADERAFKKYIYYRIGGGHAK